MSVLSLYADRSSIKFYLYQMEEEKLIADGEFSRIGLDGSYYTIHFDHENIKEEIEIADHKTAISLLPEKIMSLHVIQSFIEISGIGHRVVQGLDRYSSSVFANSKVLEDIQEAQDLAPSHNYGAYKTIEACRDLFPDIPNVCVFDTAFHQTLSLESYLYPVPYRWFKDYGVRKYGFHGTSHQFITNSVRDLLGTDHFRLISCHLGDSGSICAIKDMKSLDVSTGFSPLSGIMMGTKSGDIDPTIIPYIMEKEGKNAGEVIEDLNVGSGLLGLSEYSNDLRDILSQCEEGNEKAILAKNKYIRRVVDYISQYYVLLGGVDVIVFTAGIGENSISIRREICERLSCLGVGIDLDLNQNQGEVVKISSRDSKVLVYVIPTNEELLVARETLNLINNR